MIVPALWAGAGSLSLNVPAFTYAVRAHWGIEIVLCFVTCLCAIRVYRINECGLDWLIFLHEQDVPFIIRVKSNQ